MRFDQIESTGLETYALELRNGRGIEIVYGCNVGVDCLTSGASFKKRKRSTSLLKSLGSENLSSIQLCIERSKRMSITILTNIGALSWLDAS